MKKIKIAFVNPPSVDTELFSPMTWVWMKSYYDNFGKYKDLVEWLEPPFKYNQYQTAEQIYDEVKEADIVLYSSYIWNHEIIDEVAEIAKKHNPSVINAIGGPHIGEKNKNLYKERWMYDYFCQVTKPGELFIQDLIDSYFENKGKPIISDICFELRSVKKKEWKFSNVCAYEENFNFLKKIKDYADANNLYPHVIIETTRGCPFQCVYCEWGGGIGTKVIKKSAEIVKREIDVLAELGFAIVYNVDANFGLYLERDLDFLKYAVDKGILFVNGAFFKTKSLDKKIQLVESVFNIVKDTKDKHGKISVVPNVGIQSFSEAAMKLSKRVDLSKADKIELIYYCQKNYKDLSPFMEFIRAMPGSTLDDLYDELAVIHGFSDDDVLHHCYYDYMILPDSEINDELYCKLNKIKLVDTFTESVEERGLVSDNNLYKNRKNAFKTISSCESFTIDESVEMFFMSLSAEKIYRLFWKKLKDVSQDRNTFFKYCWISINKIDEFREIYKDIRDTLDPSTPAKDIRKINGKNRLIVIEEFLKDNEELIYNNFFESVIEYGSHN